MEDKKEDMEEETEDKEEDMEDMNEKKSSKTPKITGNKIVKGSRPLKIISTKGPKTTN